MQIVFFAKSRNCSEVLLWFSGYFRLDVVRLSALQMTSVTVVGAGIIGLATGRALALRNVHVTVLEARHTLGVDNQTANNSGVVHAGMYYKPGSLKAKLCGAGLRANYTYLEEHNIPYRKCGKIIVALDDEERTRLERIFSYGKQNDVPDLRWLDTADEIRKVESAATGLAAIHSPHTGIVDWACVAKAYADDVVKLGGRVLVGHDVVRIEQNDNVVLHVQTRDGQHEMGSDKVVVCGGLGADKLAKQSSTSPRIVPVRGEYLNVPAGTVGTNVYPVPIPGSAFLGVHFTPTINGDIILGPNAVPEFGLFPKSLWTYPGLWRLGLRYGGMAAGEMYRSRFMSAAVERARRYVPSLKEVRRLPWYGVRAQAVDRDGRLVDDFVFEQDGNVLHARNVPSPGATSSLPIGEMIADRVLE